MLLVTGWVAALVAGACVDRSRPGPSSPGSSGAPTPSFAATDAIDGEPAPLEVLESGFGPTAADPTTASYGAIFRNPNTAWAAVRMELHVDFLDASGGFVTGENVVVTVLPGQTTAIGGASHGAGGAASMRIVPPDDPTAFQQRAPTPEAFATDDVATTVDGGQATTTGRLTSTFTTAQTFVQLAAVYRDASGAMVGGASGGVASVAAGGSAEFEIADAAPAAVVASTEVYWQVTR